MKILLQLGCILAFAYAGHVLAAGLSVPLPASVIGILLLLLALRAGWLGESRLAETGNFLTANMAFFFLPSAVEILGAVDAVRPVLFRLVFVCVVTTVLTFFAAYGAVRCIQKFLGGRDGRA